MKNYNDFYINGEYYANNPTWDTEDSPWKAKQLFKMFKKHPFKNIAVIGEVGCGSGEIMYHFSQQLHDTTVQYVGYDISPQAINLANTIKNERNLDNFRYEVSSIPTQKTDILFCVDVFEHIENEYQFLRDIKNTSKNFLFNIPLDISVQSILREHTILAQRERVGHINYYTKNLALATLRDCGYEVVDYQYGEWFRFYPSHGLSTFIINCIRKILMKLHPDMCVKVFGGSSLIVLAR